MGAVNFSLDRRLIQALKSVLPLSVLVESGTFEGGSLASLMDCFDILHSIELSPQYFQAAQQRFHDINKIRLYQGDSREILSQIRRDLPDDGVLYFLDAHWCVAANTAGETSQCPLLNEIASIGYLGRNSVVIIDDARLFLAPPPAQHEISQWPNFDQIYKALLSISSFHQLMVINDLVIFYPNLAETAVKNYAIDYGVDWLDVMSQTRDYENLRRQFDSLNLQCEAKEIEIKRLDNALKTMQGQQQSSSFNKLAVVVGEQNVQCMKEGSYFVPTQTGDGYSEGSIEVTVLADGDSAAVARCAALEFELIRKEAVIQQQARALTAYRAVFTVLSPLLCPISFVSRHVRSALRPRLGNLNQHPPCELKLPSSYTTSLPLERLPSISIVTPSFKQAHFLGRTIDSVLGQGYPKLEYFVQDGGSTDGTTEVLQHYSDRLTGWLSEKDGGQSHAINLGFARTSGEIMAWLNSDDLLIPGALHRVGEYFAQHPEVDVVYGHRILIDEQDREIGRWVLPTHDDEVLSWADFIPQETLFWRRAIWEKAGGHIDESFRFAMDWDLLLRLRDAGARMVRLPWFLGAFRIHEAQKTSAQINEIGTEEMARLRRRALEREVSWGQIHRALMPYLIKHVAHDIAYRIKRWRSH